MANPRSAKRVVCIGAGNLSGDESATIAIAQRGRAAGRGRVEAGAPQGARWEIDAPVCKILIDVTQDVRALHRGTEGAGGAICRLIFAVAHAENRRHEATHRPRNLVAVEIKIGI